MQVQRYELKGTDLAKKREHPGICLIFSNGQRMITEYKSAAFLDYIALFSIRWLNYIFIHEGKINVLKYLISWLRYICVFLYLRNAQCKTFEGAILIVLDFQNLNNIYYTPETLLPYEEISDLFKDLLCNRQNILSHKYLTLPDYYYIFIIRNFY